MATSVVQDTQAERDEARRIVDAVAPDQKVTLSIRVKGSSEDLVSVSPQLSKTVLHVLAIMADGGTASFGGIPEVLTTSEAARILGISRPTLMKRIREGLLPHFTVGTHTRLRRDDVLEQIAAREDERAHALNELRELEFAIDSLEATSGD